MSTGLRVLCVVASLFAAAVAWGWWRASTHAALNIRIEDYGLRTDRQLYGNPHGAAIEFFDADRSSLATAKSIEPYGYVQAFHPDAKHIFSSGRDTLVKIWRLEDGKHVRDLGQAPGSSAIHSDPKGCFTQGSR